MIDNAPHRALRDACSRGVPIVGVDATRVAYLTSLTLEDADRAYQDGRISDDEYDGYRHAWRNGAARFTDNCLAYATLPDGTAREIGRAILATIGHAGTLKVTT